MDKLLQPSPPGPVQSSSAPAASRTSKPTTTIRPSTGWSALNLRQIWQFRDLLSTMALRDVKLRYRQTALGALWVVLQPLLAAGIFTVVFSFIARMPSQNVPYFPFAFAGMLAWNVFSSTLTRSSSAMVANSALVSKVYFPRLILPLSTAFSCVLDFCVALVIMAILMAIYGIAPHAALLLLPIWLFSLLLLALGLGLCAAALMVSYRDVGHVLPVFVNLLLYASPVAFPLQEALRRVDEHFHDPRFHLFFVLNPLSSLLEAFRWSILGTPPPRPEYLACALLSSAAIFFGGAFVFRRMERKFADVI